MPNGTLRVRGYKEFLRAVNHADKNLKREVRETFRQVGEVVRVEAAELFSRYDGRSAAGYRVRVRQRGVSVEQSMRKTTGQHPEYGSLQMRKALLPALGRKEPEVEAAFEKAVDKVADIFERE